MPDLPTIADLLDPADDYRKLRLLAAPVIEHSDILSMPMEVIAELLVKKFEHKGSSSLALVVMDFQGENPYGVWFWWIFKATPTERIALCLVADWGKRGSRND